jgi:hypothetical protein
MKNDLRVTVIERPRKLHLRLSGGFQALYLAWLRALKPDVQ